MDTNSINRRMALLAPLFAAAFGAAATPARAQQADGRALVAYVTRSGNTRVIAGALSRQFNSRLFEIRTAEPYPEDYEAHVAQARAERDARATPELAEQMDDLARYDTVFLGSPVWGGAMPAPLRSFLTRHDLTGKIIAPFITHDLIALECVSLVASPLELNRPELRGVDVPINWDAFRCACVSD